MVAIRTTRCTKAKEATKIRLETIGYEMFPPECMICI